MSHSQSSSMLLVKSNSNKIKENIQQNNCTDFNTLWRLFSNRPYLSKKAHSMFCKCGFLLFCIFSSLSKINQIVSKIKAVCGRIEFQNKITIQDKAYQLPRHCQIWHPLVQLLTIKPPINTIYLSLLFIIPIKTPKILSDSFILSEMNRMCPPSLPVVLQQLLTIICSSSSSSRGSSSSSGRSRSTLSGWRGSHTGHLTLISAPVARSQREWHFWKMFFRVLTPKTGPKVTLS